MQKRFSNNKTKLPPTWTAIEGDYRMKKALNENSFWTLALNSKGLVMW